MIYKLFSGGVIKTDDGLSIPNDPGNRDWRKYQDWLSAGNQPLVADALPVPEDPLTAEELFDMVKAKGVVLDTDRPRPRKAR